MLWIGSLSNLERLATASFVANGHDVHLYVYEEMEGVPAGVTVIDANKVLPEERIFRYGPAAGRAEGSVANFANLFRYKLLYERGGWWVDTDVVCLRPFDFEAPYVFGYQDELINNAVLRLPAGSDISRSLYEDALALGADTEHGRTGPRLMTEEVTKFGLQEFALASDAFYPIQHQYGFFLLKADSRDGLLANSLRDSYAVHFWHEVIRRMEFDKNATYPATSIFETLKARYGITRS
jgi:hypothetical protein